MRLDPLPKPWSEWLTTATCEYLSASRVAVVGVDEDLVLACQAPDILSLLLGIIRAHHPQVQHVVVTAQAILTDMHAWGASLENATVATTPVPTKGSLS